MAELTQHERYLRGDPLTPALQRLRDGEPEPQAQAIAPHRPQITPITDDDREHLRHLIFEPGWGVFTRILDNLLVLEEDTVKRSSRNDPLMNRDKLASEWAYVAMQERFRDRALFEVKTEILKLDAKGQEDDADVEH